MLDGAASIDDQLDVGGRPLRLRLSAGAFFQANRDVAALAYAAIARALAVRAGERVVDAYCGVGGIALALAADAGEVIGIEVPRRRGRRRHGLGGAERRHQRPLRRRRRRARAGARSTAPTSSSSTRRARAATPTCSTEVARLAPRAVAYLSCDPDTLARDLAVLAAHGYHARTVTPFDMLPHTPHVEALAVLART